MLNSLQYPTHFCTLSLSLHVQFPELYATYCLCVHEKLFFADAVPWLINKSQRCERAIRLRSVGCRAVSLGDMEPALPRLSASYLSW